MKGEEVVAPVVAAPSELAYTGAGQVLRLAGLALMLLGLGMILVDKGRIHRAPEPLR